MTRFASRTITWEKKKKKNRWEGYWKLRAGKKDVVSTGDSEDM